MQFYPKKSAGNAEISIDNNDEVIWEALLESAGNHDLWLEIGQTNFIHSDYLRYTTDLDR